MRRIETSEQREKRRKRTARMMGLFMLGILFIGTLGYAFSFYGEEKYEEGSDNFDEEEIRGVYINNELVLLQYPFEDTRNTSMEFFKQLYDYSGKPVYVDSNNSAVYQELGRTIGRFSSKFQQACYEKCGEDLPEKNCESNMIIFRESDEKRVFSKDNCVFVNGDMKSVDAFIYKIFGVK